MSKQNGKAEIIWEITTKYSILLGILLKIFHKNLVEKTNSCETFDFSKTYSIIFFSNQFSKIFKTIHLLLWHLHVSWNLLPFDLDLPDLKDGLSLNSLFQEIKKGSNKSLIRRWIHSGISHCMTFTEVQRDSKMSSAPLKSCTGAGQAGHRCHIKGSLCPALLEANLKDISWVDNGRGQESTFIQTQQTYHFDKGCEGAAAAALSQ